MIIFAFLQYSRRAFIVFVKWVFQAFMTQLMCPEQRMEREWRENEKSELPFFLIETTALRNQLNNHKVGEQFLMRIVKQQGAPSCTSNLCLQGNIKVDRQHKHTPTQRNGLACAGWPLDREKKYRMH